MVLFAHPCGKGIKRRKEAKRFGVGRGRRGIGRGRAIGRRRRGGREEENEEKKAETDARVRLI